MKEKIGKVQIETFGNLPENMYCDGEDIEKFILQVLKEKRDIMEVLREDNRWPVLYHLSPIRENIVLPMKIESGSTVLELGSGMGAVTGAIAQRSEQVDCVDMSLTRCQANAYRNQERNNVHIYVGDIMKFDSGKKYDAVLLIGVLEYASSFSSSENPFQDMLQLCRRFLKPNGKLYIAIENRLGIKYLAGCNEDHLGKPFVGVEGYSNEKGVCTFSRSELIDLITSSGFETPFFYYPLPDYKLPWVIYSDDFLPNSEINIETRSNYDSDRLLCFEDVQTLRTLGSSSEFQMLANSFLIETSPKGDG